MNDNDNVVNGKSAVINIKQEILKTTASQGVVVVRYSAGFRSVDRTPNPL